MSMMGGGGSMFGGGGGSMFGGGGGMPGFLGPNTEMKLIALILPLLFGAGLAAVGDSAVFGHPPKNWIEVALAYPIVWMHAITRDRLMSFIFVGLIWASILGLIGFIVFQQVMSKIMEPMMIKKKLEKIRREKELINKYDDGTI